MARSKPEKTSQDNNEQTKMSKSTLRAGVKEKSGSKSSKIAKAIPSSTKPQLKSVMLNPAMAFKERITTLILHDVAYLRCVPNTTISNEAATTACKDIPVKPNTREERKLFYWSKEQTKEWSSRAVAHTKLFQQNLKTTSVSESKPSSQTSNLPKPPSRFRLGDLVQEIQDMIFRFAFLNSSGRQPKLLLALQGDKMYDAALAVYCKVNEFTLTPNKIGKMSALEKLDDGYLHLVNRLTVVIPNAQQYTTSLPPFAKLTSIQHLTLKVSSLYGLQVVGHNLITCFPKIQTLHVAIKRSKQRTAVRSQLVTFESYVPAVEMIDKMLSEKNELEFTNAKSHIRVWKAGAEKKFKMRTLKTHVKFD